MKRTWKYDVVMLDRFTVNMPTGAQLLDVQMQGKAPVVWALVDPSRERADRTFRLLGTGEEGDMTGYAYVGTFQWRMGLVFHLFVEEES